MTAEGCKTRRVISQMNNPPSKTLCRIWISARDYPRKFVGWLSSIMWNSHWLLSVEIYRRFLSHGLIADSHRPDYKPLHSRLFVDVVNYPIHQLASLLQLIFMWRECWPWNIQTRLQQSLECVRSVINLISSLAALVHVCWTINFPQYHHHTAWSNKNSALIKS